MKNLSSLSKATYLLVACTLFIFAVSLSDFFEVVSDEVLLILEVTTICSTLAAIYYMTLARRTIKKVAQVANEVAKGNFEVRLLNIADGGELKEMSWRVNELIDRSDAYVRESNATMSAVAENIYHRNINRYSIDKKLCLRVIHE